MHRRIADVGDGTESGAFGGAPQVHYLDLRGLFLTEDGAPGEAMAGDALHISAEGKRRWKEQVLRWTEQHLR